MQVGMLSLPLDTDKSGRKVHNLTRFAFCAYPAEYDWRHKLTFIINQEQPDYNLYSIDNGGKPITEWPTDEELTEQFTRWPEPYQQNMGPVFR